MPGVVVTSPVMLDVPDFHLGREISFANCGFSWFPSSKFPGKSVIFLPYRSASQSSIYSHHAVFGQTLCDVCS
jgi:hypothetical protein